MNRRALAVLLGTIVLTVTGCSESDQAAEPPSADGPAAGAAAPATTGQPLTSNSTVALADPGQADEVGLVIAQTVCQWDTTTDTGAADAVLRAGDLIGADLREQFRTSRPERPPVGWTEPRQHQAHAVVVDVTPGGHTNDQGYIVADTTNSAWRTYTVTLHWAGDNGWVSPDQRQYIKTELRRTNNRWAAAQLTIKEMPS